MLSRARRLHLGGLLFFVMAIAVGCGGAEEGEAPAEHTGAADAHGGDTVAQTEIMAVLATADAADGTEDHVVAKCAGCKLGMDGSADYTLKVEGYEMQFCGTDCKSHFEEDTETAVMALKQ